MILEKGCAERGCACYDVRVDEGVEVKGVEIGGGCKGVVGLAEFSGVTRLRRQVRETCLGDTEFVGEG